MKSLEEIAKIDDQGIDTMANTELERLSRRIAHALRHAPDQYGLTMDTTGAVDLNLLAMALKTKVDTVRYIADTDEKGRYAISGHLIRATQGHSVPVNLPTRIVSRPGILFHGTQTDKLKLIYRDGVLSRSRNHVHLTKDLPLAWRTANRRKNSQGAVIVIDGNAMVADGHTVLSASNGVILVDNVPAEFIIETQFIAPQ